MVEVFKIKCYNLFVVVVVVLISIKTENRVYRSFRFRRTPFFNTHHLSSVPVSPAHYSVPHAISHIRVMCTVFVLLLYAVPTGKSLLLAQPRPSNRPIPPPGQPVVKPDIGPAVVVRPVTRPPLAGPYAFSRIPAPLWNNKPRVFLRHALQDTWLFANLSTWYGRNQFFVVLPYY